MKKAWYEAALAALKGIFLGEQEEAMDLPYIDLCDPKIVTGTGHHKIAPLGEGASLYKVKVNLLNDGTITYGNGPFDVYKASCIWAEPGSEYIYVLTVPGATGSGYVQNMDKLGFIVEDGPKTFKRLKRLFSVATLASTRDFSMSIGKAPDKLVDGMAFASRNFLRELLGDDKIRHGDLFTYSYVGPLGMAKGTLVAFKGLKSDLVVHQPNIKPEIKTKEGQVFYLESVLRAKVPSTDLQTMINAGMIDEFKRSFNAQIKELATICMDPNKSQDWLEKEFPSQDWYKKELQSSRERKTEKPHLTIASEMGLDCRVSPVLRYSVYKYHAARMDITSLKARIQPDEDGAEMGCRAYMIPQLDQFNKRGDFEPSSYTVLSKDQISFPRWTPELPCVVIRQPNGPGEAAILINIPGLNTAAVQLSPLAIDPELAKVYDMPARDHSILEDFGGADMDDALVAFFHENAVGSAFDRLVWYKENEIPKSNMEELIDRSVQSNTASLDRIDQTYAAVRQEIVPLGEAVNEIMAWSLTNNVEMLKKVSECETDKQLRWLIDQYNSGAWGMPVYPDVWFPTHYDTDKTTWERGAKLPRVWVDPDNWKLGKRYIDAEKMDTKLGDMVKLAGDSMRMLHRDANDPSLNQSWISTPEFVDFLKTLPSKVSQMKVAEYLDAAWEKISGNQKATYSGNNQAGWQHIDKFLNSPNAKDKPEQGRYWGLHQASALKDLSIDDKMAVTAILALKYAGKMWQRLPNGQKAFTPRRDSLLWNPAREPKTDSKGKTQLVPIEGFIGIRECWIAILLEWQTRIAAVQAAGVSTGVVDEK